MPPKSFLKKTAVPTLNLPLWKNQPEAAKQQCLLERERKEEPVYILQPHAPDICHVEPSLIEASELLISETNLASLENPSESLELKYSHLLEKFSELQKNHFKLMQDSKRKIKSLNDLLNYYKKKCYKMSKNEKAQAAEKILKMVLTENQVRLLLKKKKLVRWTSEEIAVAFTIRYYSKKCYLYIKNKLHYPLPGLSSLRRWAAKININQGLLRDVLSLLKLAGEDKTEFERTVVLQFDEVKIKTIWEYDIAGDQVLGPYSQMQVVMARGLFCNWKQPVYIAFDQKMTQEILLNIISKLHDISYNVVACVSDCGGGNVGLWKTLNVDVVNTSFKHPNTDQHVYMFADAPHLLKLLRNWLLDTGFDLGDTVINKKPLENLIRLTDNEVNVCYKISEKHINCEKSQRQNVRLAAQLLSNTVGQALMRYKPGENKKLAEDVGAFICNVDKWFDIFNSYTKRGKVPNKSAYGTHLEMQERHLNKMIEIVSSMRAHGKNALQIFQKGMIMSIKSLKSLFEDMKSKFNAQYICTHKLNQDCLENFFFQLRSRGPNEHPSPLTAIKRIRMIILGKNPGVLEAQVNTVEQQSEEYVLSTLMKAANVNVLDLVCDANTSIELNQSGSTSSFSSGTSDTPFDENTKETTNDSLEYIAGYLAKKFQNSIPNLGDYTYQIRTDHSYNLPSWVQQLSYGGLVKPKPEWFKKIVKWNTYFEKFHGDSFRKVPSLVQSLALKIKKKDTMPLDIIKAFCKLRTIIRINFKNLQAASEKSKKELKRKSTTTLDSDLSRKKVRKLNKITN